MAKKHDYFGWNYVVSLILTIIPVTSMIFGIVARFVDKKPLAAILRFFLGWNVLWISDIICMIVQKRIIRILNI